MSYLVTFTSILVIELAESVILSTSFVMVYKFPLGVRLLIRFQPFQGKIDVGTNFQVVITENSSLLKRDTKNSHHVDIPLFLPASSH